MNEIGKGRESDDNDDTHDNESENNKDVEVNHDERCEGEGMYSEHNRSLGV